MPPDANEQHARDEELEAELLRQQVDAEISAEFAHSPSSSQDGYETSPTTSGRRQGTLRGSQESAVELLGARGTRNTSLGGTRRSGARSGGLSSSFAEASFSRLGGLYARACLVTLPVISSSTLRSPCDAGPDPADLRASQALSQSQRLPSGEMSAVLSSLQSLHASAHFPTPAKAEGGGAGVVYGTATSAQAEELLSLVRDMRQEMREMDEQRQRDSDSMKMQVRTHARTDTRTLTYVHSHTHTRTRTDTRTHARARAHTRRCLIVRLRVIAALSGARRERRIGGKRSQAAAAWAGGV